MAISSGRFWNLQDAVADGKDDFLLAARAVHITALGMPLAGISKRQFAVQGIAFTGFEDLLLTGAAEFLDFDLLVRADLHTAQFINEFDKCVRTQSPRNTGPARR